MAEQKPVWQEMGLTAGEYEQICELLGREPNYLETGLFAVLWSEHCSYKNSRPVLKRFPTEGKRVLQGPGENAGAVDIGDGQAVIFKVESHNHPSAIEPYEGAATGVGGVTRDIFTMGARPIASLNSLRFGSLDDDAVRHLLSGVIEGIGGYGNRLGVPTVGGDIFFHSSFKENPLVNAMSVGLVDHDRIVRGRATGPGNLVLLAGAKTGSDGVHGCTFASEELSEETEAPAVQRGDPFLEKLLMEACLEVMEKGYVVGIQDLGAAGLTSSSAEMAGRAGTGIEIDVSLVPIRDEGVTPYEIMLSESQERMLLVLEPQDEQAVKDIYSRWGVEATVVGKVTEDNIYRRRDGDEVIAEIPVKALTDSPVWYPEQREPEYYQEVRSWKPDHLPVPNDLNFVLSQLLASTNIASKEWVYTQFDHTALLNTVVGPGADAAVLRIKGSPKGIAMTTDGNSRYCYLDPRRGGAIAVAEAARNLSCVGAEPVGLTDGLNFGNPEKPEIFWQFCQAVEGISEACQALDIPVVSGNVSFYNESNGEAIFPTPVVGMIGFLPDAGRHATGAFRHPGDKIVLLGKFVPQLGASEYLALVHNLETGKVPDLDLEQEKRVQECCRNLIRNGSIKSAHDCAEGGLAVTMAECCISGKMGATIELPFEGREDNFLFGEVQSCIIITCTPRELADVLQTAADSGISSLVLGQTGGNHLIIRDTAGCVLIKQDVEEMEKIWRGSISKCF
jgi:phosphoribosylformylglycinamidine synthase II